MRTKSSSSPSIPSSSRAAISIARLSSSPISPTLSVVCQDPPPVPSVSCRLMSPMNSMLRASSSNHGSPTRARHLPFSLLNASDYAQMRHSSLAARRPSAAHLVEDGDRRVGNCSPRWTPDGGEIRQESDEVEEATVEDFTAGTFDSVVRCATLDSIGTAIRFALVAAADCHVRRGMSTSKCLGYSQCSLCQCARAKN
jgi:hypothetical protein